MFTNQISPPSPSTLSQPEGEPDVKAKALLAQAMKAKEIGDLQRALLSFASSSNPSIKVITIKSPVISTLNVVKKTGLIDSGASNPVRPFQKGKDPSTFKQVEVGLAVGSVHMSINDVCAILGDDTIQPIVPMQDLADFCKCIITVVPSDDQDTDNNSSSTS